MISSSSLTDGVRASAGSSISKQNRTQTKTASPFNPKTQSHKVALTTSFAPVTNRSSSPGLSRGSTSGRRLRSCRRVSRVGPTWMAGTSPAMTSFLIFQMVERLIAVLCPAPPINCDDPVNVSMPWHLASDGCTAVSTRKARHRDDRRRPGGATRRATMLCSKRQPESCPVWSLVSWVAAASFSPSVSGCCWP